MCGRFTLTQPAEIAARFELDNFAPPEPEFYTPRFNVAPTQRIVVIPTSDGQRVARRMRWGLIPIWAKDAKIGSAMINARAEGVATKPAFRGARLEFKLPLARHYLILALGRYGMQSVGFAPGSRRRRAGAAMCRRAWSSSRHAASSDGRALFDCRTAFLLLLVSVLAGHAPTALGQRLSGKPVTLVVGSAAGGGIDIIARLLAVRLAESLVHAVIVENR